MSKSVKGVAAAHNKAAKLCDCLHEMSKKLAKKAATKKGAIGILCFLAMIVTAHFSHAAGVTEAVLYMFANDGVVSGRMSGDVKMRNGRGRMFKVPALVRNIYTSAARVNLSSFSSAWNSLSEGERNGWNNFSYVKSDRFGRPISIKGKQAYVGLNTNLINIAQATINTAPVVVSGISGQFNLSLTSSAGGDSLSLAFDPDPVPADVSVIVFATAPLRPGVYRPSQSAFRMIGFEASGAASPFALETKYKAKYGSTAISANEGARIIVQTVCVDWNTGQASAIAQAECLIAA